MKIKCCIANYEHIGKICWGNEKMRTLFHTEAERLEKYPSIKYGWDNEAYTYDNLAEEDPGLLQLMKDLLLKYPGRIQIGAVSYGQPLSYYINGESNVRQLTEGIRTDLEHFGIRPWIYIMSEHGMHAQIPQLITQAGFRGAIMRTSFGMYGVNPEYPASCILWRGLDKKAAIPAIPTYPGEQCHCAVNGYTHDRRTLEFTLFGENTMDNKILMDYPVDAPWGDLTEFCERFGGRIKTLVALRADDPRQPEEIVSKYNNRNEYPWVLDEEILNAVGKPELDVQTEVNDFHVRMPWGLCGNWIWEKCRDNEARLYTLDLLDALYVAAGKPGHEALLRIAWKMLLICQHHDVQIVGLEKDARKLFSRGDTAMQAVEGNLLGNEHSCLFNPLPWTRADAQQQPAFSAAKSNTKKGSRSTVDGNILSTPYYIVILSENGGFSSIWDKKENRELFFPNRRSGILAGNINGTPYVSVGHWSFEFGINCIIMTDTGNTGSIPYSVQWTFYDDCPRVDFCISAEMNQQFVGRRSNDIKDAFSAFQHEEKLRLKFYPNLPDDAMGWRDQPFGVAASNRQSLECNHWAAISDGQNGFAVFNHGVQCVVREQDGALSVPVAFSMHYVWDHTKDQPIYQDDAILKRQINGSEDISNREYFLQGIYTTRFAFLPFTGTWEKAQLHRRALEFSYPCVHISEAAAAILQQQHFILDLPENIFLSSLYHTRGSIYLRLYEMEGKEGRVCAQLHGKSILMEPVDFFENAVSDALESAVLMPYQVKTYHLVTDL